MATAMAMAIKKAAAKPPPRYISSNLRFYMDRCNIDTETLAEYAQIGASTLRRHLKAGGDGIQIKTLRLMARRLGCTVADLVKEG